MKKINNQAGSAHVVTVVILVLVILGLLGFVFWQNFMKPRNATATNPSKSVSVKPTSTTPNPYANWISYTSDRDGFAIKYPSDWKLSDASATAGDLVKLASPDIVKEQNNSPDAVNYDVDISFEPTAGSMIATQQLPVAAYKLSQNGGDYSQYATKKYTETINSTAVTEFDMTAQSPYFAAVFTVGNKYVVLSFPYAATKADMTTTLTNILSSFTSN